MNVTDLVKRGVSLVRNRMQGDEAPKATDLLERQHREVDLLFGRIKRADSGRERRALVTQLAEKLNAHMMIEQEIFYPACQRDTNQGDLVAESFEEHAVAKFALERLLESDGSGKEFEARTEVLKELIHHHVKEEENELFPKVKRQMGAERLEKLGAKMKARFDQIIHRATGRSGPNVTELRAGGEKRMAAKRAGGSRTAGTRKTAAKKSTRGTKVTAKKSGRTSRK